MSKLFALVRRPDESFIHAISTKQEGVDFEKAIWQWESYCGILNDLGVETVEILSLNNDPDGVFVEDPLVVIPGCVMTDSAQTIIVGNFSRNSISRSSEKEPLCHFFWNGIKAHKFYLERRGLTYNNFMYFIGSPGIFEGGDVLSVERQVFIGISSRTNENAFRQVKNYLNQVSELFLKDWWRYYRCHAINVPADTIHLKTAITYQGAHKGKNIFFCRNKNEVGAIIEAMQIASSGLPIPPVDPSEFLEMPEPDAANCVTVNGMTLIPANCPKSFLFLEKKGFVPKRVDISEFQKKDGSLSCLSRFFYM